MTSFGRLSRPPSNRSTSVSASDPGVQRDIRRLPPSQTMTRPCRSSVVPLPSPVFSRISSGEPPGTSLKYLPTQMSEKVRYPSRCQIGPSTNSKPVATCSGSVVSRMAARSSFMLAYLSAVHLGLWTASVAAKSQELSLPVRRNHRHHSFKRLTGTECLVRLIQPVFVGHHA